MLHCNNFTSLHPWLLIKLLNKKEYFYFCTMVVQ